MKKKYTSLSFKPESIKETFSTGGIQLNLDPGVYLFDLKKFFLKSELSSIYLMK